MYKKIIFSKNDIDSIHYRQLNKNVKKVISKIPLSRIKFAQFRAVFFPLIYICLYLISINFYEQFLAYNLIFALMGITLVLIFINLVHDAVHDSIFRNKSSNQLLLYFFDLMGGNSYIWKKRHKILHHRYQNISGWDSDIEQAGLFKIYPHDNKMRIHNIQPILVFFFYPLFLLNWLFIRDFKDFFSKKRLVRKTGKIPMIEYFKLFFFKFIFIFYIVIIPIINGVSILSAISSMIFMIVIAGIFALLVLLTPHINITNKFPIPNNEGMLETSWLKHQFETTNDITLNNWASRNILGNFNLHLAHHLFPKVNSCYAPEMTNEVAKYAKQNGLGYKTLTLTDAFKYHYKLIKMNAQ